jgi:DNA-binding transcriptional MerR regulator
MTIRLATASKLYDGTHHNWTFYQDVHGVFVAKRQDDEKIYRRSSAREILELIEFFKQQGFFVRKYKQLLDLTR